MSIKLPADRLGQLRSFYDGRVVCVTGGAGFIGGHLVDVLHGVGASVRVIDDLSNSSIEHLAALIEMDPDRVRFVHGSILDEEALREAVGGCKTVFHLAAVGSVPKSIEDPQRTWVVNATGTMRVLETSKKAGVERVVCASSSSVYGDQPDLPKVESQPPRPMSPYAASKLAGEHLASVWSQCYGLSTVSLRFFNVFGPRQASEGGYAAVVAAFCRSLLNADRPVVYGDGTQTRDFTFVSNVVLGILLAGATQNEMKGQAANLGTGRRISVLDLATAIARQVGMPTVQPIYKPGRAGDVLHSQADVSRAKQLFGYEPITRMEDGLQATVEWFRSQLMGAGGDSSESSGGEVR